MITNTKTRHEDMFVLQAPAGPSNLPPHHAMGDPRHDDSFMVTSISVAATQCDPDDMLSFFCNGDCVFSWPVADLIRRSAPAPGAPVAALTESALQIAHDVRKRGAGAPELVALADVLNALAHATREYSSAHGLAFSHSIILIPPRSILHVNRSQATGPFAEPFAVYFGGVRTKELD